MPRPSPLTHAEAVERAALISVESYAIDLDLTTGAASFACTTWIRFRSSHPGASTFVELRADRLVSATLNGRPLVGAYAGNRLELTDLRADNELVVSAEMAYSNTGEGMHRFRDPADGELYLGAYLGIDNAQRVFANFDQPDLKAPIRVSVQAPPGWTVLSNALGRCDDTGKWEFAATPALSTAMVVLVAGPLHSVRREHRGIDFGLHCRRSLAGALDRDAEEILDITRACFDRYLELFDEPYAFDSYDQTFVPELNWGAMETPGCIIFSDEFLYESAVTDVERQLRGTVIAHEMAHMWFGDLVTMRWWDDLWLSESFAEYMGFQVLAEVTGFRDTWTSFAINRKAWGYDADQRPSTHPVAARPDQVIDTERALSNFDGISYAKGASVLRQLVAWLGRDGFMAGVNQFLTRHRFGVATLTDLLDALSDASGHDVQDWATSWLRTTGVDTLRVTRGASGEVVLEHPGSRQHRIEVGWYDLAPGGEDDDGPAQLIPRGRTTLTLPSGTEPPNQRDSELSTEGGGDVGFETGGGRATVSTPIPPPDGVTTPDLILVNDGDLSYCKVRLDARSWAAVEAGLGGLADPLSRAVAWTAARDLVRDGELDPESGLPR